MPEPETSAGPFASWVGHHAGLRVPSYEAALAWYVEKLDFRPINTIVYGTTTFAFLAPAGNNGFGVELVANENGAKRPPYTDLPDSHNLMGWHHLCIRCQDVEASVEELKRRGVIIVSGPFDVPGFGIRIAFFADPWGNLFELLQPLEA